MRRLAALILMALIAGCGSDDEGGKLPGDDATFLLQQLDVVERQLAAGGGACERIQTETLDDDVRPRLRALPRDVDPDLRNALDRSFARLSELAAEQCDATEETPPPTTETTPPLIPEPEPPTTTETTPSPRTETQPQQQPPRQDEDRKEGKGPKEDKDQRGNQTGGTDPEG